MSARTETATWTDALWAADDLRAGFGPACDATPAVLDGRWGVTVRHGGEAMTGTAGQARQWLEARNAPAGEAVPGASPAGQGDGPGAC